MPLPPFLDHALPAGPLREAIGRRYRMPEPELVAALIADATLPSEAARRTAAVARRLVEALRARGRRGLVESLLHKYSLSSDEGIALMCLAEALLRIPDTATRDALIRDKIADQDWEAHLGDGGSLFANAATWALLVTGRLTAATAPTALPDTLRQLVARAGEPAIRAGVATMMRLLGEQFVRGQTIARALARSRRNEALGFTYSYDMLGEAAMTAADAAHYYAQYEAAIHAIGAAAAGRGVIGGPGISIKLSALHPRYAVAQYVRVVDELLPRVLALAALCKRYDIGLNIDAEEADRLELSLDLVERLALCPELDGWHGLGFVVQAYGRRAEPTIAFLVDLARRSGHRLMIRLVKGAYWDSEIKRAQLDGQADFPVFTRKLHTDISYVACARRLLAARAHVFPQFATHNAQTLASIYVMAGDAFRPGDYEFQCLHGMGEGLYGEVVGPDRLDRPCRIYAPVGTHETLLAYLVRRLLENGANSSFVNRIADPTVPVDELIADPVALARKSRPLGAPHAAIAAPPDLFAPARRNSLGLDLSAAPTLAALASAQNTRRWTAAPALADATAAAPRELRNPADPDDIVGTVVDATPATVERAFVIAEAAAAPWAATPRAERARLLEAAADLIEQRREALLWLIVREAGKTMANAVGEIREAVDFLRYYASEIRDPAFAPARPLGPVVCISPWNFPLAIFTGQLAAALVAGNPVLAKPAEETPLVAAAAVALLHEAGVPREALQLLTGDGTIGSLMTAHPLARAILFTGSTAVARLIQRTTASRLTPEGCIVPLIAETGGINAMIVDSSALAEQVVADVLTSGFDSAGQRCSALRLLLVQADIYPRLRDMLIGATAELSVGNPARLATDIGPIISAEARDAIAAYVESMRRRGFAVHAAPAPAGNGHFVAPTLIEVGGVADVEREVFGPVIHLAPYRASELPAVVAAINATGYGLTFGLHTRLDSTIERVTGAVRAGNIYVNRNTIGAVVGVQPFGGSGLSGTGPKAGGPLYLHRLVQSSAAAAPVAAAALAGPVGEDNRYRQTPRLVLLHPLTPAGRAAQLAAVAAAGATAVEIGEAGAAACDSVLIEGDGTRVTDILTRLAAQDGPIPLAQSLGTAEIEAGRRYDIRWLLAERAVSINTTAAGGNASLMSL
jgi:RHH-type proline utilization regulon transcriptional repressor/proline dehydrogenase/delta 1-pyrroline-5-carboxylate dehydrogenase